MTRLEFIKQMPHEMKLVRLLGWLMSISILCLAAYYEHFSGGDSFLCVMAGMAIGACVAEEIRIGADARFYPNPQPCYYDRRFTERDPRSENWKLSSYGEDNHEPLISSEQLREHITKATK